MRKRVDISSEQVELLQQMADYEGHGNINAALGTLIKFGLPLYMSSRGDVSPTPALTQKEPTAPLQKQEFKALEPSSSSSTPLQKTDLATSLGFRYTKDSSSKLVEEALASNRAPDYCVEPKPTYSEVSDESVAALAGFVDSF